MPADAVDSVLRAIGRAHRGEEVTFREAGLLMGCSKASAECYHDRALEKLRELLGGARCAEWFVK